MPTLSVSPKSPTSFAPSSPPSVNAGSSFPALSPTRQASRSIPASTDLADLITRIAGMGFPEASASHAAYKVSAAKKQAGVPGFVTENEVIEFLINETAAEAKKPKSEPTEGARECSVCFDHQIGAVLIPCGHASYCFQCAEGLRKKGKGCAICRKKIEGVTKLYF